MKFLRVILLILITSISMMFIGCSQATEQSTNAITKEKYTEELKNTLKKVFEEEVYTNKDEVLAFSKDMKNKADKDEQSNLWYYNDQIYLLSIKNMYLDLHSKLSKLSCSDDVIASIHNSIIVQLEDLTEVTSILLKEYSNNTDPKSLNTSVPNIKLIFTDNPNEYTISELVRNEVNGRIKRINSSIESITNEKVLDISKEALDNSDSNIKSQEESKKVKNSKDNIEKARKLVLQTIGENKSDVVVEYYPNPGSSVDSDKYYSFSMSYKSSGALWDFIYLVDKSTFEIYELYSDGSLKKAESNQNTEENNKNSSNESQSKSSNQIQGGITSGQALKILEDAYNPKYIYTSDFGLQGNIDYEAFDEVNGIEAPAYQFGFIEVETGYKYIAWVFGNGTYKIRCIEGME